MFRFKRNNKPVSEGVDREAEQGKEHIEKYSDKVQREYLNSECHQDETKKSCELYYKTPEQREHHGGDKTKQYLASDDEIFRHRGKDSCIQQRLGEVRKEQRTDYSANWRVLQVDEGASPGRIYSPVCANNDCASL